MIGDPTWTESSSVAQRNIVAYAQKVAARGFNLAPVDLFFLSLLMNLDMRLLSAEDVRGCRENGGVPECMPVWRYVEHFVHDFAIEAKCNVAQWMHACGHEARTLLRSEEMKTLKASTRTPVLLYISSRRDPGALHGEVAASHTAGLQHYTALRVFHPPQTVPRAAVEEDNMPVDVADEDDDLLIDDVQFAHRLEAKMKVWIHDVWETNIKGSRSEAPYFKDGRRWTEFPGNVFCPSSPQAVARGDGLPWEKVFGTRVFWYGGDVGSVHDRLADQR